MDVSQQGSNKGSNKSTQESTRATEIIGPNGTVGLEGPQGEDLIRSISAIAGLAESSVKSEVSEMLSLSGQPAQEESLSNLSLDQLRAAMLVYLETINADMESSEESSSSQMPNS